MRRCEVVAIAIALAIGTASFPAFADHAAAQARFEAGRKLAREGKWQDAATEFRASLAMEPSVGGYLNLGNAYEKLEKFATAAEQFQRAEQLAGAGDAERAGEARARRDSIASKIPTITVTAASGSTVVVDDKATTNGAPVPVDPGVHVVTVTAHAGKSRKIDVEVKPGDRAKVVVPADDERPQISMQPAVTPATDDGGTLRTVGWIGIGVGAAALVASGVFYGLAVSDKGSLEETCPAYPRCRTDEIGRARDLDDSARSKSTISTVMLIGGASFVTAGVIMLLVAPRARAEAREPRTAFSVGPTGASATLRW
jgi:Tetratricopeptide repeat